MTEKTKLTEGLNQAVQDAALKLKTKQQRLAEKAKKAEEQAAAKEKREIVRAIKQADRRKKEKAAAVKNFIKALKGVTLTCDSDEQFTRIAQTALLLEGAHIAVCSGKRTVEFL